MKKSRFLRNLKLGLKDLLLHKGRSILTSLGVVFGVGSVIAMLSVGEGASEQALSQIRRLGSNNILLSSMKPSSEIGVPTHRWAPKSSTSRCVRLKTPP